MNPEQSAIQPIAEVDITHSLHRNIAEGQEYEYAETIIPGEEIPDALQVLAALLLRTQENNIPVAKIICSHENPEACDAIGEHLKKMKEHGSIQFFETGSEQGNVTYYIHLASEKLDEELAA